MATKLQETICDGFRKELEGFLASILEEGDGACPLQVTIGLAPEGRCLGISTDGSGFNLNDTFPDSVLAKMEEVLVEQLNNPEGEEVAEEGAEVEEVEVAEEPSEEAEPTE